MLLLWGIVVVWVELKDGVGEGIRGLAEDDPDEDGGREVDPVDSEEAGHLNSEFLALLQGLDGHGEPPFRFDKEAFRQPLASLRCAASSWNSCKEASSASKNSGSN